MKISTDSHAAIESLISSGSELLQNLGVRGHSSHGAGSCASDAVGNIQRYLTMLRNGQASDDAHLALRGANLLTTVNKGMGDTEISNEEQALGQHAFAVMRNAIKAATFLREDVRRSG